MYACNFSYCLGEGEGLNSLCVTYRQERQHSAIPIFHELEFTGSVGSRGSTITLEGGIPRRTRPQHKTDSRITIAAAHERPPYPPFAEQAHHAPARE